MGSPSGARLQEPRRRDAGLDALRVLALALMLAAHFYRHFPHGSAAARAFEFVVESAPALFFFAFGMTFDFFQAKSVEDRIGRSAGLLLVALAHNLMVDCRWWAMDFLFFLWLWQVLLALAESAGSRGRLAVPAALTLPCLLMLIVPYPRFNAFFERMAEGPFPLLPWGAFFLLGVIFARTPDRRRAWWSAGLAMIAAGWLLMGTGRSLRTGWFEASKDPLSLTYVLIFCGLCVLIVLGTRRIQAAGQQAGWLARGVRLISANLLLATVLHYPVFEAAYLVLHRVAPGSHSASGGDHLLVMVLAIALLVPLMAAVAVVRRGWDWIKDRAFMRTARARYWFVVVVLLLVAAALSSYLRAGAGGLLWYQHGLTFGIMLYAALELGEMGRHARAQSEKA